jgi:hypothetical protein
MDPLNFSPSSQILTRIQGYKIDNYYIYSTKVVILKIKFVFSSNCIENKTGFSLFFDKYTLNFHEFRKDKTNKLSQCHQFMKYKFLKKHTFFVTFEEIVFFRRHSRISWKTKTVKKEKLWIEKSQLYAFDFIQVYCR